MQTVCLAQQLADRVYQGDCIALSGDLGAGKSTFARAFLKALARDESLEVPSPSFALVQPYDTPKGPVFHYDLWRLSGPEGLYELNWDEACEAIMVVEWPDRAEDLLPQEALHVHLTYGEKEEERHLTMSGWPESRLMGLSV
nr:tRNA (adenosine(37)-N6)-threonylcarbamoyltransferase complex ATPase subunit type 1 TsaE [Saccharibacter sp. 17.LH.SD]